MERTKEHSGLADPDVPPACRLSVLLLVASLAGCSGVVGSGSLQPPPSGITVSVTPASASLLLGDSQAFTASVANSTNTAVNWSVNGIPGGNAALGTIAAEGVYTAPAILPNPARVMVQATSVADPSKSGAGTITITSTFSLAVTGPASLNAGSSATFTATLTPAPNSNPSRIISWGVRGAGCTGSACGAISSSGVYTAPSIPPSPATVDIVATPQADPTKAASLRVAIVPVISVSLSPTSAVMALGASQEFQATVSGAQDSSVTWDVNGVVGGNSTVGTIPNSQTSPDLTTYTAPLALPSGGSVTVRARSNANPSVSASATVTFTAATNVALSPSSASLAIGQKQTFSVRVNNTLNQNVNWIVNGTSGGNTTTGQICVSGSNPCQPISTSNSSSVDYLAPAGLPSPNPVVVTATSVADSTASASASITILPHILVSVLPGSAGLAGGEQQRFAATVAGTSNQQVTWSISGTACGTSGACGTIDSSGLYTAPPAAPSPDLITITATSTGDTSQSGTATVTITVGPSISSLAPTSAYAGSTGGFTLLVSGSNFSPSSSGPGSTILLTGTARTTSCAKTTQCSTSLAASDLSSPGNLSVQAQNPSGSLSNTAAFVVLAAGSGPGSILLTPGSPTSAGNDIVVVDLSTNGGSGATANVSLNVAAIGSYNVATSSCTLGGSPVVLQRPASGTAAEDVCVFSVSGLDPSFTYAISGPATPDIIISGRQPLGLGIVDLTLQVPATAAPGPRTLFVENPEKDMATGTGASEVR